MEKKLAKAKQAMEAKMDEKVDEKVKEKVKERVKAKIQAYVQSTGFTNGSKSRSISNEELSDNSCEDRQQSLSPVSLFEQKRLT
ncbi:protein stu1-like [Lycium barbarum]|uniref:protein stu1-like n=1 Tax=Lycium barbarum TaxID=112863 RepID=UPI00293EB10D|nr:protein stu1-like [Lycium barbarum]XP_060185489.1 protein stu1-like [Lycium barbarum]